MTQIGFLPNNQKKSEINNLPPPQCKGMQLGVQIIKEFFDSSYHPALIGQERELFYMTRLRKIKEIHFDHI